MALLGESENLSGSENGQPQPQINGVDPAILNNIQSRVAPNPIYVNDFHDSSTGALSPTDYYPGMNLPTHVGSYSGSEVGSLSLFAPSGQLMPLGLMDARELAVKKAALAKQMEQDNFYKQHQAPVTKHVSVQPYLTDQYHDFIDQSISKAKSVYGKNWMTALQQDPTFNRTNRNFQDLARFHDAIIEHSAQLDTMEKDPNFVLSPETKKAQQDVLTAIAYKGQNPFSQEGQDIGKKFLAAKAQADMDVVTNKAIDKAIPDLTQLTPEQIRQRGIDPYTQRGKVELANLLEKEGFSDEAKKRMAHDVYMSNFQGTGVSEEDVLKNIDAKLGEKIKRQTIHYDKYFPPKDNAEDDYTNVTPQVGKSFNFTSTQKDAKGNPLTVSVPVENAYNLQANDSKKVVSLPINDKMHDVNGTPLNVKSGNVQGNVSGFGVAPYDSFKGRFLSQEEVEKLKAAGQLYNHPGLNFKPVAFLNVNKSETGEGEQEIPTGQTITVPLQDVKGKYKSKGLDAKMNEVEQESTKQNDVIKQTQYSQKKSAASKSGATYSVNGKQYSQDAIDKAAKASGMSREEYLKAVNGK